MRLSKIDLFGRMLHAAAQPSMTYLLLLLGLVGIVFELFHPSTGPAGISGLAALAFAVYGVATLGGSWIGVALIVAGVGAFCIDLRYSSLGPFTIGGFIALVSGSLLLFRSPWLRVSPWVLALGVIGIVLFLLGAMTRVLRDLRAIARGELEVTEAHPHPDGQGGHDDA
jgi:membrane-bound serine protease (ClpP class)